MVRSTLKKIRDNSIVKRNLLNLPIGRRSILNKYRAKLYSQVVIKGKLYLQNPKFAQFNKGAFIENLSVDSDVPILVDSETHVKNKTINKPAIFTKSATFSGQEYKKSVMTFSLDLEGGVALAHACKADFSSYKPFWNSKKSAQKIKNLFEKHEIPSSWATCGHLFLESCDGNHDYDINDWYGPWFKHDPASDYNKDSAWYMPDLIKDLNDSDLSEVGYHYFAHFDYFKTPEKIIKKDLEFANYLRKKESFKLRSFVYPYNNISRPDLVSKSGFTALRGYIARDMKKILQFPGFNMFCTTYSVNPESVTELTKKLDNFLQDQPINFFTHPFNWQSKDDFSKLDKFLRKAQEISQTGIKFIKMEDVSVRKYS